MGAKKIGECGEDHTVAGSLVENGSRHMLQASSEQSSKAAEEDEGAEMGGMCDREGGGEEEEEVKLAMESLGAPRWRRLWGEEEEE